MPYQPPPAPGSQVFQAKLPLVFQVNACARESTQHHERESGEAAQTRVGGADAGGGCSLAEPAQLQHWMLPQVVTSHHQPCTADSSKPHELAFARNRLCR